VKRALGLDFAVREQRLRCKCWWPKARVLPSTMCKCKMHAVNMALHGEGSSDVVGSVGEC